MDTRHRESAAIRIAYVITTVWVVSFTVDLFVASYEPPSGVQALMIATAGFLFGSAALGRRNGRPKENASERE